MAKEKVYSEVLNLRIDEAMQREIKRIAGGTGQAESETARSLIEWGIEAHRAREAELLKLRYDIDPDNLHDRWGGPLVLEIGAKWVQDPSWEPEGM